MAFRWSKLVCNLSYLTRPGRANRCFFELRNGLDNWSFTSRRVVGTTFGTKGTKLLSLIICILHLNLQFCFCVSLQNSIRRCATGLDYIICLLLAAVSRKWNPFAWYNEMLEKNPIRTKCISSGGKGCNNTSLAYHF